MIRAALWSFVAVVGVTAVAGRGEFGGMPAMRALQAWWTARQFEAAALNEDADGLARLGVELVGIGAGDAPLRFAAHRLGFQMTGESWAMPPVEVRTRALQGLELLEDALAGSDDPYDARLIQALILVNRLKDPIHAPQRRQVTEEWLAAGGGPRYPFTTPADSYLRALDLAPSERSTFLAERFRITYGVEE